jgi:hypothetical protein
MGLAEAIALAELLAPSEAAEVWAADWACRAAWTWLIRLAIEPMVIPSFCCW